MRASMLVFMLATASCSAANFDTAGAGDDDGGTDDVQTDVLDQGGSDSAGRDAMDVEGSDRGEDGGAPDSPGELAPETSSLDADAPDLASDGCTLHEHFDPLTSKSFDSCLPTGVLGDASTYSPELLDDEIAFAEAHTPGFSWGARTALSCDGESCAAVSFSVDGGVAWVTWCSTGALAGYFVETTLGGAPSCPIVTGHGGWR